MRLDQAARALFLQEFLSAFVLGMRLFLQAEADLELSVREGADLAALPRRACIAAAIPMARSAAIACKLCERSAPAQAITIEGGPRRNDGTRRTTRYDIDMVKCIYCGLCQEACPVDGHSSKARIFEVRDRNTGRALLRQGTAAANGDRWEREIAKKHRASTRRNGELRMILTAIFFYLFAAICVASAFMVIAAKNPVQFRAVSHSRFRQCLRLSLLLGAEFLAMILIIVYVGAVLVLFLFVVMMLDVDFAELPPGFLQYMPIGAGRRGHPSGRAGPGPVSPG